MSQEQARVLVTLEQISKWQELGVITLEEIEYERHRKTKEPETKKGTEQC